MSKGYKPRPEFSAAVERLVSDLGNLSDGSIAAGRDEWEWFARQIVAHLESAYALGYTAGEEARRAWPTSEDVAWWADGSLGREKHLYSDMAVAEMARWREWAEGEK